MFLNKYNLINNKEIYTLILLILFSISIRIPFVALYGDGGLQNEWNALIFNLVEYKQLGWVNCQFAYYTTKVCFEEGVLLPNLWMPPLYAYYLYFFKFLNLSEQNYILLILSSQIFIGAISVAAFYKINKIFFSNKLSLYSSLLFSIFPLYIYASVQISSISLQVFLTVLFFYFFFQLVEKRNLLSIVFFSFTAGLLILLRGEFYAILILTIFYLFFIKINIKKILLVVLITSITISPYLIRNVLIFEEITMMKSFGYNLWKGNHPYAMKNSLAAGSEIVDEDFQKQLDEVPRDKFLRFNFEKLYLDKAVKNIKEAINHILKYGTMHTDSIVTNKLKTAEIFLNGVNSSIAMHNVSTQFADGGEFGFGGEVGISTNKLPPRGPVGINQLTSYKYVVTGNGIIRP